MIKIKIDEYTMIGGSVAYAYMDKAVLWINNQKLLVGFLLSFFIPFLKQRSIVLQESFFACSRRIYNHVNVITSERFDFIFPA